MFCVHSRLFPLSYDCEFPSMIVLSAVDFYFWSGISFAEISLFIDYITVLLTLPLFKYLLFMEEISEANRL